MGSMSSVRILPPFVIIEIYITRPIKDNLWFSLAESRAIVDGVVVGSAWIRQGNRSHHQTNLELETGSQISTSDAVESQISNLKEPDIEESDEFDRHGEFGNSRTEMGNNYGTLIIDRFRVGSGFQIVVVFIYTICESYVSPPPGPSHCAVFVNMFFPPATIMIELRYSSNNGFE